MRAAVLLLALASVFTATPLAAAPARVASINLCTDALLFELADPAQIASVTHLSREPALSVHAARAQTVAINRGRAEELIALNPDLVLAGAGSNAPTITLLRRFGYEVAPIATAATLPEVIAIVHEVGALLGQQSRAATLAAALAALAAPLPPTAPGALIVQPGGYVPGPDTLGPTLLELAGLRDLAPTFGLARGGFASVEALVLRQPAVIVRGTRSMGRALADDFLAHPALAAAHRARGGLRTVAVNDAAWACGSSALRDAVLALRAAVQAP